MRKGVRKIVEGNQDEILPVVGKYIQNKKVLDAGCGNGINSFLFEQKCGSMITLLDRKDMREKEVLFFPFFKSSVDKMPFKDKSFDVVLLQYVLHHLSPKVKIERVIDELKRVAKVIIIIEEIYTDKTNKQKAKEFDSRINKILHPHCRMAISKYYNDEELKKHFNKAKLNVVEEEIIDNGCKENGFLQRKIYVLQYKASRTKH